MYPIKYFTPLFKVGAAHLIWCKILQLNEFTLKKVKLKVKFDVNSVVELHSISDITPNLFSKTKIICLPCVHL